jgi:hypothetical protein
MKAIFQVPLRYGSIAGLLGAIIAIGLYYMGWHPFLIPVFFDFRIVLFGVFIFFTLREYRDLYRGGNLMFGEGLFCSFIFITIFGLVASGIIGLFGYWNDTFITSFVTTFKEQISQMSEDEIKQIGKENIDRNLSILSSTNAVQMAVKYFVQSYMIGFLISIVLSVILRRQT